jgi:hypothetical protein
MSLWSTRLQQSDNGAKQYSIQRSSHISSIAALAHLGERQTEVNFCPSCIHAKVFWRHCVRSTEAALIFCFFFVGLVDTRTFFDKRSMMATLFFCRWRVWAVLRRTEWMLHGIGGISALCHAMPLLLANMLFHVNYLVE